MERKTARGAKITVKVSNSPQTPKIRKWAAAHNKKRHMEAPPITPAGPSADIGHPPTPPVLIRLKKKSGKVNFPVLRNQHY